MQEIKKFVKKWFKELLIAMVLAVVAAVGYELYKEWHEEKIIENNKEAVAVIFVYDKDGSMVSQGSGVFIKSDGTLITNYHVLEGGVNAEAKLPSGAFYKLDDKGPIVGISKKYDFAILRFDAENTPYARRGNSDEIVAGDSVITIGSPEGLESSVSAGVISNPRREFNDETFIQFTAPISPGSSGGGLFDKKGEVIGLTTAAITDEGVQNINFAIPINLVTAAERGEKTLTTGSAAYYYAQAKFFEDSYDYDNAIKNYEKAVELDDEYAAAYLGLGSIYYERGQYDLEVENYQKAVAIQPDSYEFNYFLGTAYEDVGLYNKAVASYKKALEIKPDDQNSLYDLTLVYLAIGDKLNAKKIIPRLKKANPGLGNELEAILNQM